MFIATFSPFFDAEFEIVVVFLMKHDGLVLAKFGATGGIREDGVLDYILMNGFDEWIVGNGLDED